MNKILCFLILLTTSATNSMELASTENSANLTRYELEEETLPSQEDSDYCFPLTADNKDGILLEIFDQLITCFDKNTLITFSKVNHTYRYLCFPPKLKHFLDTVLMDKPNKSAYSLARYLKKSALAERFLCEGALLDNRSSLEKDIQAFRDNSEVTLNQALELTKNVQYSPTFWAFGGSAYLKEVMNRRSKQFKLGILGTIKSFCHSIRQDPTLKYGSLSILSTALILTSYDLYTLYYTPLSSYKCYDYEDLNGCKNYYSTTYSPLFRHEAFQRSPPLCLTTCSENLFDDKLKETICLQLNEQVMWQLVRIDIIYLQLIFVFIKIFFKFFI